MNFSGKNIIFSFYAVLLFVLFAAIATPHQVEGKPPPRKGLYDRLEVIVGEQPITYCEVEAEAHIALARRQGPESASGNISLSLHEAVREYLINQYIVIAEANLLQIFNVEEKEIDEKIAEFRKTFKAEEEYKSFLLATGIDEKYLRGTIARNIRVEKFLDYRVKTEVYISPTEVISYYNANKSRFGSQSFNEVESVIYAYIAMQKQIEVKKEWLKRLKGYQEIIVIEIPESNRPLCKIGNR